LCEKGEERAGEREVVAEREGECEWGEREREGGKEGAAGLGDDEEREWVSLFFVFPPNNRTIQLELSSLSPSLTSSSHTAVSCSIEGKRVEIPKKSTECAIVEQVADERRRSRRWRPEVWIKHDGMEIGEGEGDGEGEERGEREEREYSGGRSVMERGV
jgi:hypothetical protein